MIRNKLYDEFEAEGYSYIQYIIGGQLIPHVYSLTNNNDWLELNPTVIVNGQMSINKGSEVTEKTIKMAQRLIQELNKPDYCDWYSKALFENKEEAEN